MRHGQLLYLVSKLSRKLMNVTLNFVFVRKCTCIQYLLFTYWVYHLNAEYRLMTTYVILHQA